MDYANSVMTFTCIEQNQVTGVTGLRTQFSVHVSAAVDGNSISSETLIIDRGT